MHSTEAGRELISIPTSAHGLKFCDTLEIDYAAQQLYAGDNWAGGVDVFDVSTTRAEYLKTIRARGTFYGVAVASELQKVFVGMNGGNVIVIDTNPSSATADTIVARIELGGRGNADLIDYDPDHRKVYIANRNDGFMTAIDAEANAVVRRIDGLGGALEQPRHNAADGMVYLSGNADNVLYQIDTTRDELVNTFEIGEPCHPNGLAINPATQKAVLANSGRNTHCVVWDLEVRKLDAVVDETGGGDGIVYDPVADRFFFAAAGFRDGPVIGIFDGAGGFLGNVPTARLASWVAYDRAHGLLYAPTVVDGLPALLAVPLPAV